MNRKKKNAHVPLCPATYRTACVVAGYRAEWKSVQRWRITWASVPPMADLWCMKKKKKRHPGKLGAPVFVHPSSRRSDPRVNRFAVAADAGTEPFLGRRCRWRSRSIFARRPFIIRFNGKTNGNADNDTSAGNRRHGGGHHEEKTKTKKKTVARLFNHNLFRPSETCFLRTERAATDPSSVVSLGPEFFPPREKSEKLKNKPNN